MHNACVEPVINLRVTRGTSHKSYSHGSGPVGNMGGLSDLNAQVVPLHNHSFFAPVQSVNARVVPIIHTTNKNKEQDLFNFLIISKQPQRSET